MKKMRHAFDPSGHPVFFESYLLDKNYKLVNSNHFHLRIAKAIEYPTVVIDIIAPCPKRYYFRAVNWEHTLLVCVNIKEGMNEVEQYIENPSGKLMAQLYRKAKYVSF